MKRRQLALMGVAGVIAAGAGAAWSWRRAVSDHAAAEAALWAMTFQQPDGRPLVLAELRGRPLLLNFWATWCAPCVKEMPMLDRFYRDKRASGWSVVGLAVDGAEPVRAYLSRLPMSFPIGLAGMEGVELSSKFGNTQGGLPFTVVFDRQGKAVGRRVGALNPGHLERWERDLATTA
jgi:thiol-disulfide isomerase/thioredoxin